MHIFRGSILSKFRYVELLISTVAYFLYTCEIVLLIKNTEKWSNFVWKSDNLIKVFHARENLGTDQYLLGLIFWLSKKGSLTLSQICLLNVLTSLQIRVPKVLTQLQICLLKVFTPLQICPKKFSPHHKIAQKLITTSQFFLK